MRRILELRAILVACGVTAALFVNGAAASDMTPAPVASWQGFYAGAHGGYSWSQTDWDLSSGQFFNPGTSSGSASFDGDGGFGGVHAGYNIQSGSFVYGLEAGYTWFDSDETIGSPLFAGDRFTTSVDGVVTVAGRVGAVFGSSLVYAKAGYASGEVETRVVSANGASRAATSERSDGWVIGAGVEHQLSSQLIIGLSYDYIDLGSEGHSTTLNAPAGAAFDADVETEIHALGLRASFKFN